MELNGSPSHHMEGFFYILCFESRNSSSFLQLNEHLRGCGQEYLRKILMIAFLSPPTDLYLVCLTK